MIGTNALAAKPQPNPIFGSPGTGRNSATAKRRQTPETPIASGWTSGWPKPCAPMPVHRSMLTLMPRLRGRAPRCRAGRAARRRPRRRWSRSASGDRQRQPDLRLAVIDLARDAEERDAVRVEAGAAPGEQIVVLAGEHVEARGPIDFFSRK